uniref:C45 family autoproteolytic acyltransferase/hydolase n=1 Tax=Falsiroseomonas oryzae TaxID=2766473 RepID=UPI0022EA2967
MTAPHRLLGDPRSRGLAFAALGAPHAAAVRRRTEDAFAFARTRDALGWLDAQWQAQQSLLPDVAAFMEGLAAGHDIPVRHLFAAHARYAVEDRAAVARPGPDGCSAFALADAEGGVLLAKNRDNPAAMRPLQSLVRQADPAWGGREILCVGGFGSSPSASSGINSDGFCLADTAVRTADLGIGALRYYVMEALLIRCTDVGQALTLLRALPHLGGGTLVMGDASGAIAAVELGHGAVAVEMPSDRRWVARTNHFLEPALARHLREAAGSPPRRDSDGRLAALHAALGAGSAPSGAEGCVALLARHAG